MNETRARYGDTRFTEGGGGRGRIELIGGGVELSVKRSYEDRSILVRGHFLYSLIFSNEVFIS